jgi:hypothetical protein
MKIEELEVKEISDEIFTIKCNDGITTNEIYCNEYIKKDGTKFSFDDCKQLIKHLESKNKLCKIAVLGYIKNLKRDKLHHEDPYVLLKAFWEISYFENPIYKKFDKLHVQLIESTFQKHI